jgi:hypothetical protein
MGKVDGKRRFKRRDKRGFASLAGTEKKKALSRSGQNIP